MAGTYSDNLEFNSEQLMAQIKILESVRDMIIVSKTKYIDYITTQLMPNWTTEAGKKTTDELINFAEIDIQSFIAYLDERISNLTAAQQRTIQIDQA